MLENNKPHATGDADQREHPTSVVALLYVTFPSAEAALAVGRDLVGESLATCINVLPAMTSVYVWQGVTETASEAVMIAKLATSGLDRAVAYIQKRHPYEMPAIMALPVVGGSAAYLQWLRDGTKAG